MKKIILSLSHFFHSRLASAYSPRISFIKPMDQRRKQKLHWSVTRKSSIKSSSNLEGPVYSIENQQSRLDHI